MNGFSATAQTRFTSADEPTPAPSIGGELVEVPLDPDHGIDHASVVTCDGLYTVSERRRTRRLGSVDDDTLDEICGGVVTASASDPHRRDRRCRDLPLDSELVAPHGADPGHLLSRPPHGGMPITDGPPFLLRQGVAGV
jgi:hypothetical protein